MPTASIKRKPKSKKLTKPAASRYAKPENKVNNKSHSHVADPQPSSTTDIDVVLAQAVSTVDSKLAESKPSKFTIFWITIASWFKSIITKIKIGRKTNNPQERKLRKEKKNSTERLTNPVELISMSNGMRTASLLTEKEREEILSTDTQPIDVIDESNINTQIINGRAWRDLDLPPTEPINMTELLMDYKFNATANLQTSVPNTIEEIIKTTAERHTTAITHGYKRGKKGESYKTFSALLGATQSNVFISPRMRRQTKWSLIPKIVTDLTLIPFFIFLLSFVGLALTIFPITSLEQIYYGAVRAGFLTAFIMLIWLSIDIPVTIIHNLQIRDFAKSVAEAFNHRYSMNLSPAQAYDLINDFRIPVNVNGERREIRLTSLENGMDARLVFMDTGKEIPVTFEMQKTDEIPFAVIA